MHQKNYEIIFFMALASTSTLSEGQDNDLSSKKVCVFLFEVFYHYFTGIRVVINVTKETSYDGQVLIKDITDIVNNRMKIHNVTPLEVNLFVSTGRLTLNTYTCMWMLIKGHISVHINILLLIHSFIAWAYNLIKVV